MWHSKYKAVKYLGVAFTSSFGAYVGVRHFLSVRDLKAEIRADNAKDEVRFQYYIKSLVPLLSYQSSLISKIRFYICKYFQKSVVIVGAGVMGLGTAFHLAERGFDVTVLEKEDSVAKVSNNLYSKMQLWPKL